ncbi:glucosyltransferase domain-containing protein [Enterobacter hormaechei]|uniref:glucosyltransferase domain-containing protein n=1 Tax=Enterobacter hormaechei TaxID=158836 RepID=UPI001257D99C|nr:glucosyltransferase domain-containing protein [Enterobacter hormaechei]QLO98660.1 glucosyltransferase domain-containing protein [Enterobacter hormaechei]VAM26531.1 Uncharacterised protein [Enterobacter hormaechei]
MSVFCLKGREKEISFNVISSVIYILPLLFASLFYRDDLGRAIWGGGWDHDGRYITTWIMEALSTGKPITDIFPYGTIASAIFFGISGLIITNILGIEKSSTYKISSLYVVTYPFIIENLAYRYDALSMGLSFLACCIPFLMRERSYTFIFASVACIYFSLLTYQSSLFVYILICMALCAKSIIDENKVPFKHIIECIISVVLAMALAKITWHLKDADFHGRDALFVSAQNPVQALEVNFRSFYDLLTRVYGYSYLKLMFPIILSAVGFIIFGAINFICNKQYKRLSLAILLVPIFGLMVLLSPGLNLFLAKPFWTARTMMCLVVIFYLVIMLADRLLSRHHNIKKIIFSLPLIYSFALMSAFCQSQQSNNNFYDKVESIVYQYTSVIDKASVVIVGKPELPTQTKALFDKFPILTALSPLYYNGQWVWGPVFMMKSGIATDTTVKYGDKWNSIISKGCSYNVVYRNSLMKLYQQDKQFILSFDKNYCG